jgi:hypothetical protein
MIYREINILFVIIAIVIIFVILEFVMPFIIYLIIGGNT